MKKHDRVHSLTLLVSWLAVGINAVLALVQAYIGWRASSISVLADAVDSLRDVLATGVVIISLYVSRKPADEQHPYGHGRSEDIGGFTISLLLLLIGAGMFKESAFRLFHPKPIEVTTFAIVTMFSIAVIKFILGYVTGAVSRKASSQILKADALHHYTDCVTTVGVAVGLLFVRRGFIWVDSCIGLAMACLIVFWGFKMTRDFVDNLMGKTAGPQEIERTRLMALSFNAVNGVHDIQIQAYGKRRLVSLHIELDPLLKVAEAHSVADSIERKICQQPETSCVVHVDVAGRRNQENFCKSDVEQNIAAFIAAHPHVKGFHASELSATEQGSVLGFHLQFEYDISLRHAHALAHELADGIKKKFGFLRVNIHVEPCKRMGSAGPVL